MEKCCTGRATGPPTSRRPTPRPMPRDRYAESQTPTRAHHEQRRDVALQLRPVGSASPAVYVEPPPGTLAAARYEPPPTPRGKCASSRRLLKDHLGCELG